MKKLSIFVLDGTNANVLEIARHLMQSFAETGLQAAVETPVGGMVPLPLGCILKKDKRQNREIRAAEVDAYIFIGETSQDFCQISFEVAFDVIVIIGTPPAGKTLLEERPDAMLAETHQEGTALLVRRVLNERKKAAVSA